MRDRAVVVDDDALSREFLVEALEANGFKVSSANSAEEGIARLKADAPDLVVTDLKLPGRDGLFVLEASQSLDADVPVVVLTAYGTVETAVTAMRAGAEDFLLKPVSPEQLELVLSRISKKASLVQENKALRANGQTPGSKARDIVGTHPRLIQAVALAERVAATDATILVRGESGTGKELIASLIHKRSRRSGGPLVKVNCAALTESLLTSELFGHERGAFTGAIQRKEGRFEIADRGTLFLDEIGEISLEVQSKLLRVLETGEFERVGGNRTLRADCRIIAATNRNLEECIAQGRFREDLFYRLNVVPVSLPPLRDRVEDIEALAQHFVPRFAREHGSRARGVSPEGLELLRREKWPGNVRELANLLQRAVLITENVQLSAQDLGLIPRRVSETGSVEEASTIEEMERRLILRTLKETRGSRTLAAERLGVTARTLSNKIKLWRLRGLACEEAAI